MLIVKNIRKKIDNQEILRDISFSLDAGEIISIIGPSGAGKTTLLRSVSLIDPPDFGSINIDEQHYSFPIRSLNSLPCPYPNLTVVFQQFFIWPHLTIRQNLIFPLKKNFDKKHFEEITSIFQMKKFLDRFPNEVSSGQNQRAAIARALLLKPKYLLLDEITSALDIEQSYLILGHLKQIAEKGAGIIFVSHSLQFAGKISKKVIFINKGKIEEEGTGEILKNPKTPRLQKFVSTVNQII